MKYYLIGIKGAGLSALSLILNDLGYQVSGYDDEKSYQFTEEKLIKQNIEINTNLNSDIPDGAIIVYSTAIKKDHPQMIKAQQMGLKMYEYYEMLGKLTEKFSTIAVAGCHGKTTTSSYLAHVLKNKNYNYLIGDGTGYADKKNSGLIIEACEYKRHFLNYRSKYAIITNIELDHVDYFKDIADVVDAYTSYANNASKMVIACGDDPYTRFLDVKPPIYFYGLKENNDINARNIIYNENGIIFDCFTEGNFYGHFELPIYGKHMLLNALAVISVCYFERILGKEATNLLKTFHGAKRRFNEIVINDTIIIDDYAHHPTEVKSVIKACKQKYPDKKIISVFEPHTFTRTQEFSAILAEVLNQTDACYIKDIFSAREKQEDYPNVTSKLIIDQLDNGFHINDDEVYKLYPYKDNVIVFMSPKQMTKLETNLINYLKSLA
ncbi:MAG: UDP-N-acetylmuramate--L-alanine ligase [Bacilli bacterium]